MRRFFIDPQQVSGNHAILTGPEAHHLIAVLRLKVGEHVLLFDGGGQTYEAQIDRVAGGRVETTLLAGWREEPTRQPALHVGLALLKGKKMDFCLQKATELGVAAIHPFVSSFCAGRLDQADRELRQKDRWARIIQEACKQCNRPVAPACRPLTAFDTLIDTAGEFDLKLICWEGERRQGLTDLLREGPAGGALLVLIGPEGGFSQTEIDRALTAGFQPVSLGRRVLRAETAALAVIAIIQYLLGNLAAGPAA